MPIRVLVMISSMRGGGSERQTLMLLRHLDRSQFVPHLYVTERVGELLTAVPDDVAIHSFDELPDSGGLYIPGGVLRRQQRYLHSLLQRESIDVIYDRTFHMTLIAGPPGKSIGIPRVSTIVSPPERALPLVESRFVTLKRRRLARAYRNAKYVVAVSQQSAESAVQYYGLQPSLIRVIRNSVDVQEIQASAAAVAEPGADHTTYVCVGRMTEEKGHRDLLAAAAMACPLWPTDRPKLRICLIGDGPLRPELERQAADLPDGLKVEFIGVLDNPMPPMAAADALILPSHFEGLPNVVLEAMALGTPVIATRAGGTVELEAEEPTILWAEPGRPETLADAMIELVNDPQAAADRARHAESLVRQRHDVRQSTRQIESLLQSSLDLR